MPQMPKNQAVCIGKGQVPYTWRYETKLHTSVAGILQSIWSLEEMDKYLVRGQVLSLKSTGLLFELNIRQLPVWMDYLLVCVCVGSRGCAMCSGTFSGFPAGLHVYAFVSLQIILDTVAQGKWHFPALLTPLPCSIIFHSVYHCLAKLSNLLIMLTFLSISPSLSPNRTWAPPWKGFLFVLFTEVTKYLELLVGA